MATGFIRRVIFLVILSGCASAAPEIKPPPHGLVWSPEAPFKGDKKIEIPAEASGLNHFLKGQLLLAEGNFEDALKEFEAAAQASPSDAFLRFRLATLYLRKGDLKKALVEAETATSLEPKSVENHLLLAGLYSSLGENQKGIGEYVEVLKLDPKNQEALLYLGALYLQLEDYDRATQKLDELIKLDPNSPLGHYYLGRVRAKNKLDEALAQFQRLEGNQADPRETRIKIGLIFYEKGDFERAATEFNLVLAGDPENDRARYYLGATYVELKADEKALAEFAKISEKSDL